MSEAFLEPATSPLPHGFRETVGGLVVPEALSRQREVWTKEEQKILRRAEKLLAQHRILTEHRCGDPACQKADGGKLERIATAGGFIFRCHHMDRIFLAGV